MSMLVSVCTVGSCYDLVLLYSEAYHGGYDHPPKRTRPIKKYPPPTPRIKKGLLLFVFDFFFLKLKLKGERLVEFYLINYMKLRFMSVFIRSSQVFLYKAIYIPDSGY